MTTNSAVAQRIKKLLNEKQITKYCLEQKSGVFHGAMDRILTDKNKTVTLSTVMLVAQGFNMSLIEFLDSSYFDFDKLEIN